METSGLITVQDVLDAYMDETEGILSSNEGTIVGMIERGMAHLSMFILENVRVMDMPVNQTLKTANVPKDFRRLIRLGTRLVNGRLYTLTRDDELVAGDDFACDDGTVTATEQNSYIGRMGGRRGGFSKYGDYKFDGRRVIFNPNMNLDTVTFEYVGSGILAGSVTYLPAITLPALVAFTKWKTSGRATQNVRLEYKQEWMEAQVDLRDMTMPTMDELMDAVRQSTTQIVTRA